MFEKGAVLGDLGDVSKKQSFALELILLGTRNNSMTEHLSHSFLEGGRNEEKLNL